LHGGIQVAARSLIVWLFVVPRIGAQTVITRSEILDKDRPEAWAMTLIGSELQMTTMGPPENVEPGEFEIGADFGWIPSLDARQRLIGFDGTKEEKVNRTPAFARPRVTMGLPHQISLGLAYIPPLSIGGIRPQQLGLGVSRPVIARSRWRIGARMHGQIASLKGDITCDAETVRAGQDTIRNPFRCQEPSNDRMRVREIGFELTGAMRVSNRLEPYIAPGWNYFNNSFQVDARYAGVIDKSLLQSSRTTLSITAGVSYRPGARWRVTAETFFVPLTVRRNGIRSGDNLFNVRASILYALR
jgi:hypothetical protein